MLHDPDSCDKSPANAGGQLIGMSADPALAPWGPCRGEPPMFVFFL